MNAERQAWDEFWKEQGGGASSCLERAPAPLRSALAEHWRGFAATLSPGTRIVDLGCGSGAVGGAIAMCRHDLLLYGVDYAGVGTGQQNGYAAVEASTAMESLPFDDGLFDAAASQFGFEYSRIDESVRELGRVLAPGAPLSLIVHHADSPIVADNRRSLLQYRRLLSAEMARLFIGGHRSDVERIASATASDLADPTVELVAQTLLERVTAQPSVRWQSWAAINQALRPEVALATALDRVAVSPASLGGWLARFRVSFEEFQACPLEVGGMPFAWRIQARRRMAVPVALSRQTRVSSGC